MEICQRQLLDVRLSRPRLSHVPNPRDRHEKTTPSSFAVHSEGVRFSTGLCLRDNAKAACGSSARTTHRSVSHHCHICSSNPWDSITVGTKSSHDGIEVEKVQATEPHISSPFADILRATNQHGFHPSSVMHEFARSKSLHADMDLRPRITHSETLSALLACSGLQISLTAGANVDPLLQCDCTSALLN
jgi:hypothetical protein